VNCGLQASNIQIFRSLSRGITVAGACNASFSNFYIDTTANSGLGVGQDPNFATLVPTNTTFTNGVVRSSGRFNSPVVSGKDCIDISKSVKTTVTNVECSYPLIDGVFIDDAADQVTLSGVTVDAAPNVGIQAVNATNISLTNTVSRNSLGGGYAFQQMNMGTIVGASTCSSGTYGFYHSDATNMVESKLSSYDSSEGNSSNRAWWAENNSGPISLTGINIIDDETTLPIVVGGASDSKGSIVISDVSSDTHSSSVKLQLP
jgi:hypothetical protein